MLQGQTDLVDPTTTNRVSNDGYFRTRRLAGSQLIVTADTNGVAQINVQLALNPPELRPHFPYSGRNAGAQIPTANGLLILSNSLIAAGSFLNVTGAVPVSYGRDCTYAGLHRRASRTRDLEFHGRRADSSVSLPMAVAGLRFRAVGESAMGLHTEREFCANGRLGQQRRLFHGGNIPRRQPDNARRFAARDRCFYFPVLVTRPTRFISSGRVW